MPQKATTFVRFVVGVPQDNAYFMTGVITEARALCNSGNLEAHEVQLFEETLAWLRENLPVPPFISNLRSGIWTDDVVAWFKDDAKEPIRRMWDIVALLREHEVPVLFMQSQSPGQIVYSDEYQIVAETPR